MSSAAASQIQNAFANIKTTFNKIKPHAAGGSLRRRNSGGANRGPPTPPSKDFDVDVGAEGPAMLTHDEHAQSSSASNHVGDENSMSYAKPARAPAQASTSTVPVQPAQASTSTSTSTVPVQALLQAGYQKVNGFSTLFFIIAIISLTAVSMSNNIIPIYGNKQI